MTIEMPLLTHLRVELDSLYRTPYKHIAIKIESNWSTESAHNYMQSVLNKNRSFRRGLPPDIFKTVFMLYLLHVEMYGNWNAPLILIHPNVSVGVDKDSV